MTTLKIILVVWLFLSFIVLWVTSFMLWLWLEKRDVELSFFFAGVPGYLERVYAHWCGNNNQSSRFVVNARRIMWLNLFVAGIAYVFTV
jgi:hypothetical protein